MEPVLGGRDDPSRIRPCACAIWSRNGARPWRTGRLPGLGAYCRPAYPPQWSPSLADGTTGRARRRGPAAARRNGARPWRTGRPGGNCAACTSPGRPQWSPSLADGTTARYHRDRLGLPHRRNGARPWRTGRPTPGTAVPSPARRRNGARPWRTGRQPDDGTWAHAVRVPQWSPSLADGTTRHGGILPVLSMYSRNGARPWRTGRP